MRIYFSLFMVIMLMVPAASTAQVPRGVIAEDCTATWCVYCPAAYAGLEVMKSRYDANEFTSVRYYDTSGGLGTSETHARIQWYGVTGFPTVYFDGSTSVVGGGSAVAAGSAYDPLVARDIGVPSPLRIRFNSVSFAQPVGSVNLDVIVADQIQDIANTKIRIVICENNVQYNQETEQDVTRDILVDTPLTVSQVGQSQNVTQTFAMNLGWKPQDMYVCAFVQNDTDKWILQSGSTRPAPAYSPRFWAKGNRAVVAPSSGPYDFQDFAVFNMGTQPDVITANLLANHLPPGWFAVFTDGVTDYASVDLPLNPGESRTFHVRVTPNGPGYADLKVALSSSNLPGRIREIGYQMTTDDVQVLLVDDDGSETFENYYTDALSQYGATFGLWNTNYANVTAADLAHFPAVIWQIGLSYPTLTSTDRAALGAYLDGGGKLFINGQDFGWEMDNLQGDAITWYHTYMHADFITDDTNLYNLSGVAGDPITDGMAITIQGGDGASNQEYPDGINPRDTYASTIFTYNGSSYKGGIKVATPVYQVVYLGFGYEAISTPANRRLLVARILQWFGIQATTDAPAEEAMLAPASVRAFPNPAHGGTTLRLSLPSLGHARLGIYAIDGSIVRILGSDIRQAGMLNIPWDGKDDVGRAAPSGVYFYRLDTGKAAPSGKLILTR